MKTQTEAEQSEEPVVAQEAETEDMFVTFVSIVDELLGSNLPGDVVEAFVASEEFSYIKQLAAIHWVLMMRCLTFLWNC